SMPNAASISSASPALRWPSTDQARVSAASAVINALTKAKSDRRSSCPTETGESSPASRIRLLGSVSSVFDPSEFNEDGLFLALQADVFTQTPVGCALKNQRIALIF